MDGVTMFAFISLSVLSGFTIWHVLALRKGQQQLAQGIGVGVGKVIERLEVVEAIPEVLQELNLGGVTLQPNKTVGEMIFETIVARMTGDNTNDFNPLANLDGPKAHQEEKPT
jgi:hypothetical protein